MQQSDIAYDVGKCIGQVYTSIVKWHWRDIDMAQIGSMCIAKLPCDLAGCWWSVKPVSMGHIPRAEWFALTANRMWRCSMMPATSAMHIWCNICFIRKATLMWTWSHFGMFQQIRHKEPNPKLGRRGHLQSFALGKVMFTKPCSLFLFFLNLKIARKMPRKWKTKKQISKIKKTQKQNKREKKGKTKSKKKEKNGLVHLHFFCIYVAFSICFFLLWLLFVCFFSRQKAQKKSKKSKKSKTKATNKHIEKAKINNKNANGQVHFFLFFFLPFCLSIFSHLFCFLFFSVLKFCFLIFHVISFFFGAFFFKFKTY